MKSKWCNMNIKKTFAMLSTNLQVGATATKHFFFFLSLKHWICCYNLLGTVSCRWTPNKHNVFIIQQTCCLWDPVFVFPYCVIVFLPLWVVPVSEALWCICQCLRCELSAAAKIWCFTSRITVIEPNLGSLTQWLSPDCKHTGTIWSWIVVVPGGSQGFQPVLTTC